MKHLAYLAAVVALFLQHGAAAIRDGLCDTLLISYGSDQLSRVGRTLGTGAFARRRRGCLCRWVPSRHHRDSTGSYKPSESSLTNR